MEVLDFFRIKGRIIKSNITDKVFRMKVYTNGVDMMFTFIGEDVGYEAGQPAGSSWFEGDKFYIISGEKRKICFSRPPDRSQKY